MTVVERTLRQLEKVNPTINAIAWCEPEQALAAAHDSARRWREGTALGTFDGVPVTLKDAIDLKGTRSTFGSAAYADVPPAIADSPPAARLKEAGAVIIAKTTAPDLGMAITGLSSLYGIVRNPWDTQASPGGSSAGAGAALASGIGYGAVGTDLAGSVRIPAARCGLATLKPTQGRVPHSPPNTVRSPGAMGRSVTDVAALHGIIAQPDRGDTFGLPLDLAVYGGAPATLEGKRIGILPDIGCGVAAESTVLEVLARAASVFASSKAEIEVLAPIFSQDPLPALERSFQIRAWAEMESFRDEAKAMVLPELAQWAAGGRHYSATDYYRTLGDVMQAQRAVQSALDSYDYVISPVVPELRLEAEQRIDPEHPFSHAGYTAWFNQTGQPAAAVCFGMRAGLPVGIQVVGRRFDDWGVLAVAQWLEERRGFEMEWPFAPRPGTEIR